MICFQPGHGQATSSGPDSESSSALRTATTPPALRFSPGWFVFRSHTEIRVLAMAPFISPEHAGAESEQLVPEAADPDDELLVHGAGGAPRQAQVLFCGQGKGQRRRNPVYSTGKFSRSCPQDVVHPSFILLEINT